MSALAFAAPFALVALIALPALYYLLRLTPPPPKRLPLPTLPLVQDLLGQEREPRRTPWWLLVLRLLAAGLIILAVSAPRWQPEPTPLASHDGPLLIMLDDGWSSAGDWKRRIERISAVLQDRQTRPAMLILASEGAAPAILEPARAVLTRLQSLSPQAFRVPREAMFDRAGEALTANPALHALWITDRTGVAADQEAQTRFLAAQAGRISLLADHDHAPIAIAAGILTPEGVEALLRRPALAGNAAASGLVRALDEKGRLLGEAPFAFGAGIEETRAKFALPLELLNEISRLEVAGAGHAGAVFLMDGAARRRRVALVSGETTDTAQPLVSARYFISRALQPYSDLREAPRGSRDPIVRLLEERPDVLVLADIGTISGETEVEVARFVENGGLLIRFAGVGLAAASDDLLPVRLRRGGRILGGALSWDKPAKMGAIPEGSPFRGIEPREDIRIERQVLAEPDPDLTRASWVVLEDGTPLITGAARGKGQIVLFHVTGDTAWSNLPLSGVFIDFLRRTLSLAGRSNTPRINEGQAAGLLPPRLTLNGTGVLSLPPARAKAIDPAHLGAALPEHPAGFYGPPEGSFAVNAVVLSEPPLALATGNAPVFPLATETPFDLRTPLMIIAMLFVLFDTLAVLMLMMGGWRRLIPRAAMAGLALGAVMMLMPDPGFAQGSPPSSAPMPQPSLEDIRSSLKPRLAYVLTGNPGIDEASRAGLMGLGQVLAQRTSITLDEPVAVNPERAELVFYPMLYWPVLPDQPNPPEAAIRALDTYMKHGGTVVFDTRDAFIQRAGGQPTPETRSLRRLLASLDIPALEPVPSDHVLTKTFYLLDRLIGRYAAGDSWVEAIGTKSEQKLPARAGDRVSPLIITSNDLASAWAVDRLGQPMFPLVPGDSRQRELALRTGVNIVMYVMTGNYKADQVHVPALLERLGQ